MGERIREAGRVAWGLVGIAALLALVVAAAWLVRVVWPPLILAGALVFVLNPAVNHLQRRHVPRAVGTSVVFLGVLAVFGVIGVVVTPLASDQAEEFSDEWPSIERDLEEWVDDLAEASEDWPVAVPTWDEIQDEIGNDDDGAEERSLAETFRQVRDVGVRVFHVALIVILAPILAFYLLVDLPRLRRLSVELIPPAVRGEVLHVAARLNRAIGGFFRGQLVVALIVGIMVSVGLAVIGLDFWLLVGMIAGLFNVIPLVGPWVGGVPAVAIALTTQDVGTAIAAALIMVGAQQVDNHLISPIVMHRAVQLHPAMVLLALLAGGTMGGFFGLLLAVPTAATLKIVVGHLWRTYALGQPWDEAIAAEEAAEGRGVVEEVVD